MKVVELFAGVGGFRLAASKLNKKFDFIWANQWEPNTKNQFAFDCYQRNFGILDTHVNEDISIAKYNIPQNFDLLVGGFPCQDYSVATTNAQGIVGIKGVLWWEINWILKNRKPRLVVLENVDRLLKSPSKQRGRDFAIMLRCFYDNGYNVEWMVNNGADYGFSQRRKRVFIYAYLRNSNSANYVFQNAFSFTKKNDTTHTFKINKYTTIKKLSDLYSNGKFLEYGYMIDGLVSSYDIQSNYNGEFKKLKDILDENVDNKYYLTDNQLKKIKKLKDRKKILRTKKDGTTYYYTEGQMQLFDDINNASRTMLTSEGSINRSSHVIKEQMRYRFITPIEAERLNGFKDNWTIGMTDRQRYFCMGNALNVDLVALILKQLW